MSRTLSHVRYKHWNVKVTCRGAERLDYYRWTNQIIEWEETIGKELYDLRFYAGCKRTPQWIHRRQDDFGYSRTWGHYGGAARGIAKEIAAQQRNEWRAYAQDVVKAHRSGGDLDDMVEPEGRTRHSALWLAW